MTGYESKRAAAQDKLLDDDDALTIAYQSGYYDGKKAAQRPWVGLTDEEIDTTWKKWIGTERANKSYTLAIAAILRSKNT